jgi:hypothetical protein
MRRRAVQVLEIRDWSLQTESRDHIGAIRIGASLVTIIVFLWLTMGVPHAVLAQAPDAEVDFFLEPVEADKPLTVGDRIRLRLEIKHPAGSAVELPQLDPEWDGFEVIEQTEPETIDNEDGTATTGQDIVVTRFEPGQFQTPRLVVTHRQADGSIEELAAPLISVRITSVLTDVNYLRDIKPQAELPEPAVWPLVAGSLLTSLLLTGLVAGAALWLYHRWRTRPAPAGLPLPVIDTRPPEVIALGELDRIEAMNLPAENRIKEHYSLVANCLRFYIEGRYNIPALEQTTTELRAAFRRSTVSMQDVAAFMSIFSESDLVKFARYNPPPAEINSLIGRARTVVERTTHVVPDSTRLPAPEVEVVA